MLYQNIHLYLKMQTFLQIYFAAFVHDVAHTFKYFTISFLTGTFVLGNNCNENIYFLIWKQMHF